MELLRGCFSLIGGFLCLSVIARFSPNAVIYEKLVRSSWYMRFMFWVVAVDVALL
ncbi:hypothetical protein NRI_0621 [Neorickettsia risticii str. Illinois]|uniref:Uncharacterized protein n=1 Tax=Neorickettsia risticii (strain Illinois) TaxID=434131 RepID=C6V5D0_NEORI|nr:hypothetical protein NRI_0621 [Neorickettsia risticii str. Illinois]